jgi:short-subunit dehydrogenase
MANPSDPKHPENVSASASTSGVVPSGDARAGKTGRARPFTLPGCSAIITGASSGLGAEFARQLRLSASTLVLAARSGDALEKLKTELSNGQLQVHVVACDLSTEAGRAALWEKVSTLPTPPNLLINNAGLGDYGQFMDASEARIHSQIDLNITALTVLLHEFVARTQATEERPSAIINISSLASTTPVPDLAVYAATKSYVSSLTEGLAIELESRHIRLLAVCPGPTPTNFGKNARRETDKDIDRSGQDLLTIPPQRVVSSALHSLQAGHRRMFPGKRVALAAFLFEKMPRWMLRTILTARYRRAMSKS